MRSARLRDVASFVRGVTFKPGDIATSGVGVMRTKNIQEHLDLKDVMRIPARLVKRQDQYLRTGDTLISTANSWQVVGKACWVPALTEPLAIGGFVTALRPESSTIDARYLFRYFTAPRTQALLRSFSNQTTSIANLNLGRAGELEIPLPPLEEQRRIAAILDRTDVLRTKRRQVLRYFESLETALYRDAFSSNDWPSFRLGEVASTTSGGTPSRASPENYGGGIPWVKSGELHSELVVETSETISDAGLASSSASLMPAGTVLIAMYGATAGVVSRLAIDAATNQAVCSITPGPHLDASYLVAALKSMTSQLRNLRSGGAQPNLSQAAIRALKIKVPSIVAQQEFARKIAAVRRARQRVELGAATDDQLFAAIQSRAFRGEL